MNKAEFVEEISRKSDISKALAQKIVNNALDAIKAALKKNDNVTIVGFGTFGSRRRAARNGRNPKTGQVIRIESKKVPYFRAGKELKEAVESDNGKRKK